MPDVTTTYLEMTDPSDLRPKELPHDLAIRECVIKQFAFNRFLYGWVGASWNWVDKLSWADAQWQTFAESDQLRTWVAYREGSPAGYYELQQQDGGDVEILYFGLGPAFIGQGYGGALLTHAIRSAWDWQGTRRVWVHTCSDDHPAALANYRARGMTVYRQTTALPKNGDA